MAPRVELAAGDVSVVVDAPRVALAVVHRHATELLAAGVAAAARVPSTARPVGFAVGGCETEIAERGDHPPPVDAT